MRVLSVFGTRAEAIKMAPVVLGLRDDPDVESRVCVTAQHRKMLDQVLSAFSIQPDFDLDIMRPDQSLPDITSRVLKAVGVCLRQCQPDLVLVHGDTTTCFSAALAAFYEQIPIGHIEAGLRSQDLHQPYPEEANRRMVGSIADLHFAPTEQARQNLLRTGISANRIFVTGNTVIDALLMTRNKLEEISPEQWRSHFGDHQFDRISDPDRKMVLVTCHRRENLSEGIENLCEALLKLAKSQPNCDIVFPIHLNPKVKQAVTKALSNTNNILLMGPQNYPSLVWLMNQCTLILTDSGGLQEEGPALGKPVLVLRQVTERPEAIEAGTARLIGTDKHTIYRATTELLTDDVLYQQMSHKQNPYGDGSAAERIKNHIRQLYFNTSVSCVDSDERRQKEALMA